VQVEAFDKVEWSCKPRKRQVKALLKKSGDGILFYHSLQGTLPYSRPAFLSAVAACFNKKAVINGETGLLDRIPLLTLPQLAFVSYKASASVCYRLCRSLFCHAPFQRMAAQCRSRST
jgi:hypothetical protein